MTYRSLMIRLIVMTTIAAAIVSCNDESYIESEGSVSHAGSNPANNTGSVVFYSTNVNTALCSGGQQISVNGTVRGKISGYTASVTSCATTATTLGLTLAEGTYTYTVSGTGNGCPKYGGGSFTITKGTCQPIKLN